MIKNNNDKWNLRVLKRKIIIVFLLFTFWIIYFISSMFFLYLYKKNIKNEEIKIKMTKMYIMDILKNNNWIYWLIQTLETKTMDNTVKSILEIWTNWLDWINEINENNIQKNNNSNNNHNHNNVLNNSYITISKEKNWNLIYTNFDYKLCWKKFFCSKINFSWYNIYIWKEKKEKFSLINILILYIFISWLTTFLLYFPFNYFINKITRPVEENYEFMKNFVNNAWHELKTPLTEINLEAQVIKMKQEYNEKKLNNIINKSKKLWNMLDNLLNLSTISKKENLILNKINISNLIDDILKDNNYENKIKIIKEYNENKEIIWNIWLLKILIKNLLTNAYKYNLEKKNNWYIKIIIWKNYFSIINPWKEIPKNEIKKIFDVFHRAKNKDDNQEWFWLWLALVKKICDIMWYKIIVKSNNWLNKFKIFVK